MTFIETGIIYNTSSKIIITGYDTATFPINGHLVMPSTVTHINNSAFSSCTLLKSFVMSGSIIDIGKNAFENCTSLAGIISLPNTITNLQRSAFYGCTGITQVNIPILVTHLSSTFVGCSALETVTVGSTNALTTISGAFSACGMLTSFDFVSCPLTLISGSAFYESGLSGIVEFPVTLQTIDDGSAFSNCDDMTEARMVYVNDEDEHIPVKYTYYIGEYKTNPLVSFLSGNTARWINILTDDYINPISNGVIYKTSTYESIIGFDTTSFPSDGIITTHINTTHIKSNAFNGCSELIEISLPSVVVIESSGISSCPNLTTVTFSNNLTTIGDSAFFYSTSLSGHIRIPDTVTSLGREIFYNTSITKITFPVGITELQPGMCHSCTLLEEVAFPEGAVITTINGSFANCTALTNFPFSLFPIVSINGSAFYNSGLTGTIVFPTTLQTIDDGAAFSNCPGITNVIINRLTLNNEEMSVTTEYEPTNIRKTDDIIEYLNGDTSKWQVNPREGLLYDHSFLSVVGVDPDTFPSTGIMDTFLIGTTTIFDSVFHSNLNLIQLVFPDLLTSIQDNAFTGCTNLTGTIILPTNTALGEYVFSECSSLQEIYFSETTLIPSGVCKNCTQLTTVVLPQETITIQDEAFYGTGVTSIHIPKTVTTIGENAFNACSSLSSATISRTDHIAPYSSINYSYSYETVETNRTDSMIRFIDNDLTGWVPFGTIVVDGVIYSDDRKTVIGVNLETLLPNIYIVPVQTIRIYESAFENSHIQFASIPKSIIGLDNHAFYGCTSLNYITFDTISTCTTFGEYAFYGCTQLLSIIIPLSVTTIGDFAFDECDKLQRVFMYKLNTLYVYEFSSSSDKTSIIQAFLSSSTPEEEGWDKPIVKETNIINPTDALVDIPDVPDNITDYEVKTLITTIFSDNIEKFDKDANIVSFSLPGRWFEKSELFSTAPISTDVDANTVAVFSSFISNTITWVPEQSSRMFILMETPGDQITLILEDGVTAELTKISNEKTTVSISGGLILSYSKGDTFNIGTSEITIGSVAIFTNIPEPINLSAICIMGTELIYTDNMHYKPIASLSVKDTIGGYKINRITRTRLRTNALVLIKKNALGVGVPFKDTKLSHDHKISINGRLLAARQLLTNIKFPNVVECTYSGEILYNVLLSVPHKTMVINGIVCETLNNQIMKRFRPVPKVHLI